MQICRENEALMEEQDNVYGIPATHLSHNEVKSFRS